MGYDPLIRTLIDHKDKKLIIEWEDGLKIIGELDTVFETDNGLDDNDINYSEYYAVTFKLEEILEHPASEGNRIYNWLIEKKSTLIEISLYGEPPSAVFLTNGQNIWRCDRG